MQAEDAGCCYITVYSVRVAPSNSAPLTVHYKTNVTLNANSLVSQVFREKSEILLNYIFSYNILYYEGNFVYNSTGHNSNALYFK